MNLTFPIKYFEQIFLKKNIVAKTDSGVSQGPTLGPLLSLLYVNNVKQVIDYDLFLYADGSCLVYQHKLVKEAEPNLNKNFTNICYFFVDNKLSIYFGEDKTKSILFGTEHKLNKVGSLAIRYGVIHPKQYHTATYLGQSLNKNLSGGSMALEVINKINSRPRYLYRKNRFVSQLIFRPICNALIQPRFDYACSSCYPDLNERLKSKLQILQNICIHIFLNLNNRTPISLTESEKFIICS